MGFWPDLDKQDTKTLIRKFVSGPSKSDGVAEDEHLLWFDEVAIIIAQKAKGGVSFLIEFIPKADEPRLAAIIFAVAHGRKKLRKLRRILLPFLKHHSPIVVLRAVDSLSDLEWKNTAHKILPLLGHDSPHVVSSVLRFLATHFPVAAEPILFQSLNAESWLIRMSAIDRLDELQCMEAMPLIRPLMQDEHEYVRQAAETAVKHSERWPLEKQSIAAL